MVVKNYSLARGIVHFEGRDRLIYWRRFAMLLTLSVVIATMGLLRNSGAVVIAAMLIAPLMTPILGIAAAMVMGRVGRAFRLTLIVLVAAAASCLLAWLMVWIADVPKGVLLPDQVVARTDPGTEDLVVALASGIAGAYVQIQKAELSLLPGAAIGVSLVPPLSAAGILFYFGAETGAVEALLLFTTNLAAIVLSACVVYIVVGARSVVKFGGKRTARFTMSLSVTMLLMALIVVKLAGDTRLRYLEVQAEADLVETIVDWAGDTSVEIIRVDADVRERQADIWLIVDLPLSAAMKIASAADLLPEELRRERLVDRIDEALGEDFVITVRYQTRIAGQIDLARGTVDEAGPVESSAEEIGMEDGNAEGVEDLAEPGSE